MNLSPTRFILFADLPIQVPTSLDKAAKTALSGGFAVVAAVLVVIVAIVFWILFVRKTPRPNRSRGTLLEDAPQSGSRRRKRRHRQHTPRVANPSLAQTGGLPPLGAGEQKPPPQ
ncbi:MAG TPA: hypothetical protein VMF06_08250 [Candidatus Limnocylindria bacterium]|jgi:hypothetical protein|nr:hypothetical protein [Candidatus Limnocylindria bacterium]